MHRLYLISIIIHLVHSNAKYESVASFDFLFELFIIANTFPYYNVCYR